MRPCLSCLRFCACLFVFALAAAFLLHSSPVRAQVALKPTNANAAPLRMKALTATVRIRATQFATTDLDMRFQNDWSGQIEADFMYTVPDGAVVTDFAYFAGEERVPARIAEKARATEIYQNLTRVSRDPALVEMVGKNTFRARISPVWPNADLRVQIRYVQALPVATDGSVTYRLPLASGAIQVSLDEITVDARATELEPGARADDNLGVATTADATTARLAFTDRGFRVPHDLAFRIRPPRTVLARELTSHLIAAPSGGRDGFFALALSSPARKLTTSEKFAIAGVPVYDTETTWLGDGLLICGRYRGAGRAQLLGALGGAGSVSGAGRTRDNGVSKRVTCAAAAVAPPPVPSNGRILKFGLRAEANNPASKLWAASRIAHLSKQDRNRAAVVGLSERFTLPSLWTSWIAIPDAERERMEREAEAEATNRQVTSLCEKAANHATDARQCAQYQRQLSELIAKHTPSPGYDVWNQFYGGIYETLVGKLGHSRAAGDSGSASYRALQARAAVFARDTAPYRSHSLENDVRYREQTDRLNRLAELESRGQWDSAEDRAHWKRVTAYFNAELKSDPNNFYTPQRREQFDAIPLAVARRLAELRADGQTQSSAFQALQARLKFLATNTPHSSWADWPEIQDKGIDEEQKQLAYAVVGALDRRHLDTKQAHGDWLRLKALLGNGAPPVEAVNRARGLGDWERGTLDTDRLARMLTVISEDRQQSPVGLDLRRQLVSVFSPAEVNALLRAQAPDFIDRLAGQYVEGTYGGRILWSGGDGDSFDDYRDHDRQNVAPKLSPQLLAHYGAQMDRVAAYTRVNAPDALYTHAEPWVRERMFHDRKQVIDALKTGQPKEIQAAQSRFLDAARSPDQRPLAEMWKFFEGKNTPDGRAAFARDRLDRLAARAAGERLDDELAQASNPAEVAAVTAKQEATRAEDARLRVRMGDPLVTADFPADARSVVALMPDGTTLPMRFDAAQGRWQARFDVPTTAVEGTYIVTVVARLADGGRQSQIFTYGVDVTAPHATARAIRTAGGDLRIEVDADADTTRVDAFWSGGSAPVPLAPVVSDTHGRFFAVLSPTVAARVGDAPITITVTDRAHNRTVLTVTPPSAPKSSVVPAAEPRW